MHLFWLKDKSWVIWISHHFTILSRLVLFPQQIFVDRERNLGKKCVYIFHKKSSVIWWASSVVLRELYLLLLVVLPEHASSCNIWAVSELIPGAACSNHKPQCGWISYKFQKQNCLRQYFSVVKYQQTISLILAKHCQGNMGSISVAL